MIGLGLVPLLTLRLHRCWPSVASAVLQTAFQFLSMGGLLFWVPAWLFTILRNLFRSEYRKRRREVEDPEGRYAETLKSHPEQTGRVEFEEFRAALARLPSDQREALILVGASGFSYEDAATICGCAVGTIKSRVNRARTRLADLLAIDGVDDFGPDRATRAVLAGGGRS